MNFWQYFFVVDVLVGVGPSDGHGSVAWNGELNNVVSEGCSTRGGAGCSTRGELDMDTSVGNEYWDENLVL